MCRQVEAYPKSELIGEPIVQENFMNVGQVRFLPYTQINKALEIINLTYNTFYQQKKPSNYHQLEQAERIFSYLDSPGYIHLRFSGIFFFTGATVILERYTVPINYEAFKIHMTDFRK